jgi:hypothetical protein
MMVNLVPIRLLHAWCSGLMEQDTFMRDNIVNHKGVNYDAKTQLQAVQA